VEAGLNGARGSLRGAVATPVSSSPAAAGFGKQPRLPEHVPDGRFCAPAAAGAIGRAIAAGSESVSVTTAGSLFLDVVHAVPSALLCGQDTEGPSSVSCCSQTAVAVHAVKPNPFPPCEHCNSQLVGCRSAARHWARLSGTPPPPPPPPLTATSRRSLQHLPTQQQRQHDALTLRDRINDLEHTHPASPPPAAACCPPSLTRRCPPRWLRRRQRRPLLVRRVVS
jgi:hypothetical protein